MGWEVIVVPLGGGLGSTVGWWGGWQDGWQVGWFGWWVGWRVRWVVGWTAELKVVSESLYIHSLCLCPCIHLCPPACLPACLQHYVGGGAWPAFCLQYCVGGGGGRGQHSACSTVWCADKIHTGRKQKSFKKTQLETPPTLAGS